MMIKPIFMAAVLSATVVCTSCMDSFLDTQSPSVPSNQNVFNSASMTEAALMGTYGYLTDTYVYGQKISGNWQGSSDVEVGGNAFNTDNYHSVTGDQGAMNFYDDPYNTNTKWDNIYKMVEMATACVDGIRQSPLLNDSKEGTVMRAYLGEALTLKALGYFELVRYWGDVPFKETSSNSDLSNVYISKVDRDTIYNHIINDLQEAIGYLPWMGTDSYSAERVNKGFAKGLLAKVALFAGGWSVRDGNLFPDLDLEHHPFIPESNGYFVGRPKNWQEYYQIARNQCAEFLGSTEHKHQLDPSYVHIWEQVNGLQLNTYNENLFEVAFGELHAGNIGEIMGYELERGTFNPARSLGGGSYVGTTAYYFYSFHPEDTRRDVTCCWQSYGNINGVNKEHIARCNALSLPCGKWRWYWMNDDYINKRFPEATGWLATGINWVVMRYSDIYLMFAEAQNELEGPNTVSEVAGLSAAQALEIVRERAFGAGSNQITAYDKSSKEAFFKSLTYERAWEFGGESIRQKDLVRWGLLYENIEKMKEALVMMYDNKPFDAFDRHYDKLPPRLYYQYQNDGEYIDLSTVNFYEDKGIVEPDEEVGQYYINWIPMQVTLNQQGQLNEEISDNYVKTMSNILVCGTGLYPSYDYSSLFSRLNWGAEAQADFAKYAVGNGECYYRHFFAIYYEDIYESENKLSNSYGY